jgi:hypothetical protein
MAFVTTTVTWANETYFLPNVHVKAHTWRKYNATEKSAAWAQAVRELTANQGREMADDTTAGQVYSDQNAVAEQALWILEQTPRQKDAGIDEVIDVAKDEEKKNVERKGILISPEALMYFGRSAIKMVRG